MLTFQVVNGDFQAWTSPTATSGTVLPLTVLVRPSNLALGITLLRAFSAKECDSPDGPVRGPGDLLVINGEKDVASVVEKLYRGDAIGFRRHYWRFLP